MTNQPVQIEYTPEDRQAMLVLMHAAAAQFYSCAQRIGYHQFLELTGLMNEIIKVCTREHQEGRDFATNELRLQPYEAEYIGEKIGCIMGAALAAPAIMDAFIIGVRK